jgi:two-component system, chemotaxis family, response regulator Rcp1
MSIDIEGRSINILLVEDNPGDVRLTREAFDEAKVNNNLHVASDGVEAMEFLRRKGKFSNAPRPDLILLDLNMPRKNGREVLAEAKTDPDLMRIPIVVLTVSQAEEDILSIYDLHANCYIPKPMDINKFIDIIKNIEGFLLTFAKLPSGR